MAQPKPPDPAKSWLFYGDNLDVLRQHVASASVDLVYLDPPFNSKRDYSILFKEKDGKGSPSQIEAFEDTWTWNQESEEAYEELLYGDAPSRVKDALEAMRRLIGDSDMLAYLVMMTSRLLELHRVLKPTGSLYLHCDPTASHYLKLLLDAIFGPTCFRNEIIWRRTGAHRPSTQFGPIHDVVLFYAREPKGFYFKPLKTPYTKEHIATRYTLQADGRWKFTSGGNVLTGAGASDGESGKPWRGVDPSAKGRHWAVPGFVAEQMPAGFKSLGVLEQLEQAHAAGLIEFIPGQAWPQPVRYLDSSRDGIPAGDIWAYQPGTKGALVTGGAIDADVAYLGPTSPERLGYPTQKPVGLLKRIIEASCPDDGVVLDPFCGCGTTVTAAQALGRRWIGIDVTTLAIDLIDTRLRDVFGEAARDDWEILGIPRDVGGAQALFNRSPLEFERWAVMMLGGTPNDKQVGDKGVDGWLRFPLKKGVAGRIVVSVKGGATNPSHVRELDGTVKAQRAELGVLVTMNAPTRGMVDAANHTGSWEHPANGQKFPKIQIVSVPQIVAGERFDLPLIINAFKAARKDAPATETDTLF